MNKKVQPVPTALRWTLPSLADVIFLVIVGRMLLQPGGSGLLQDADTGWHIRNGDWILAHRMVPGSDWMSCTGNGKAWFAWEWLFDVAASVVHRVAGLNGICVMMTLLVAGTFALLFQFLQRRSGHTLIAVVLTIMAAANCSSHLLARPHIFSWLFTLLFAEILYRHEEGSRRILWALPVLMVLWVNLHGGFVLGLALIMIFLMAAILERLRQSDPASSEKIKRLTVVGALSGLATLATPYGYQLHQHIYQFLSSRFLISSIEEYHSPDFHGGASACFEIFLLLTLICCLIGRRRMRTVDLIVLLFAAHAGLYAARNLPLSGILMALALSGALEEVLLRAKQADSPALLRGISNGIQGFSLDLSRLEKQLRGHAVIAVATVLVVFVALHGGRLGRWQLLKEEFSEAAFPAKAVDHLMAEGVHDRLFSTDAWSGYLLYRMAPGFQVMVDDRFDFYGEEYMLQYASTVAGAPQWSKMLNEYHANRALLPPGFALTTLLRQSSEWKVDYEDTQAVLFCRADGCAK